MKIMKKLVLAAAILASGVSTFAMINNNPTIEIVDIIVADKFVEIAVDELAVEITDAVTKDYPTATISKAYVNISQQYKLELMIDESMSTVYIDKDGNWLEESDVITD